MPVWSGAYVPPPESCMSPHGFLSGPGPCLAPPPQGAGLGHLLFHSHLSPLHPYPALDVEDSSLPGP